MRLILAANESIGFECLKIIIEKKQDILGIILDGRYEKSLWRNLRIKRLAEENNIQIYQPKSINDPDFLEVLKEVKPDLIFNIAFVQIYKPPVLNLPRLGCINFHPGPLPRYGGLNPWVWAIINNEKEYGVSLHYMKEKVDAGEILGLKKFPIAKDETGLSLLSKCYKHGAALFGEVLQDIIDGRTSPVPQDLTQRTYYLNKIPFEGYIDVSWGADKIEHFVRALTFSPFPNPFSKPKLRFNAGHVTVTKAEILEGTGNERSVPGRVIEADSSSVIMETHDGKIRLELEDDSENKTNSKGICSRLSISAGTVLGG